MCVCVCQEGGSISPGDTVPLRPNLFNRRRGGSEEFGIKIIEQHTDGRTETEGEGGGDLWISFNLLPFVQCHQNFS